MLFLFEDGNGNSELRGKDFIVPDGMMKTLRTILNSHQGNHNVKYYQHLENIVNNGKIPYSDMKKIKHFFDTFQGKKDSEEYILNGGDAMRMWVNMTLGSAVQRIKDYKTAKKDAGIKNAFIKPHEKDRMNKNPTKSTVAKPNMDKDMTTNVMNNQSFKFESKEKKKIIIDIKSLIGLNL